MLDRPHTDKIPQFNPKRPKVSLRRFSDPEQRLAIKSYILNRGTEAEEAALAHFEAIYSRKPVGL